MSIEWWEYYEIRHNFKNLQQVVDGLKKEIDSLRTEIAQLKGLKGQDKSGF